MPPGHPLTSTPEHDQYPTCPTDSIIVFSVCAPPSKEAVDRVKVTVVLVLDLSGSMGGDKLTQLKKGASFVVENLHTGDNVGIVGFDSTVYTLLPLSRVDDDVKAAALKLITSMYEGSCTNISGALAAGFDMLKPDVKAMVWRLKRDSDEEEDAKRQRKFRKTMHDFLAPDVEKEAQDVDRVCGMVLLTDGEANIGIKRPDAMREMVQELKAASGKNVSLYTFGLGKEHNHEVLSAIGEYTYIEKKEDIATEFAHTLGGLMTLASQNVVVKLEPFAGVEIEAIDTACKVTDGTEIQLGDMICGSRRDLIVSLKLPQADKPGAFFAFNVEFSGINLIKNGLEKHDMDVLVRRQNDDALEPGLPNANVCVCKMRLRVARVLANAAAKIMQDEAGDARKDLEALLVDATALDADMRKRGTEGQKAEAEMLRGDVEEALRDLEGGGDASKLMFSKSATRGMQRGSAREVAEVDSMDEDGDGVEASAQVTRGGNAQQRRLARMARKLA